LKMMRPGGVTFSGLFVVGILGVAGGFYIFNDLAKQAAKEVIEQKKIKQQSEATNTKNEEKTPKTTQVISEKRKN